MGKNVLVILGRLFLICCVFLLFFLKIPSVFAQDDSLSTTVLLQATATDLTSQGPVVWEDMVPVGFAPNGAFSILDIEKVSVANEPGRVLFVPNPGENPSNVNQINIVQGSQIPLQSATTISTQSLSSSAYTFPVEHGNIVIDTASQILKNKTISALENSLEDIPNSALLHSAIKIIGGAGISILGGDSASLGDTVTIANTLTSSISSVNDQTGEIHIIGDGIINIATSGGIFTISATETDTLASVTGRGATTATALTLSNATNNIAAGTLTATGGTLNNIAIGGITPSSGIFSTVNGLTITNNGSNVLNIAAGKTFAVSKSLSFSGTDGTTFTFPSGSDTVVGLDTAQTVTNKTLSASLNTISGLTTTNFTSTNISQWTNNASFITSSSTDTLTNKTLTTPIINGVVTTAGLTMPAFTANGNITGSGSPTISSFGTINGLLFTSSSDGLTITGGTTSRVLTVTGADITIGNVIKPTSSGPLTVTSNGTNALNLDTGAGAGINIGTTYASGIALGTDATVSANKTFSVTTADKLTVGGTIIPQSIPILIPLTAAILTQPVFIADTTYQVTGARCVPSVVSISGTFQVTVDSGTTAAGGGTTQLTGTISLSGTANTVVSGTLIGSPTTISAGDRVSAKFGGLLTGLLGTCTIYMKRI